MALSPTLVLHFTLHCTWTLYLCFYPIAVRTRGDTLHDIWPAGRAWTVVMVASVLCDSIRYLLTCTKYYIHLNTGSHLTPPPPLLSHLFTTGYRWTHSVWTKALSATESCTTQARYRRLWTKPREDVIFSYSLFGHRSYSTTLRCPAAGLAEVV